ncbi:hypothetical protein PtA15_3A124 [Puccinia triticina]|uniref:Uncharacterized protein n=1 Tax=Puccinia triticina TaxID=208348 RepID=A0ABY7CFY7_9BASI|nr:uncharacterized protein PtA15_3A124 [Puccinia triticina]WAQ82760.1 hypothetical protein PtA15_3A124 [Puccinia triticina]WAR53599.1 hypothetical protein PtB15_3B107 [Puccinia triticina]
MTWLSLFRDVISSRHLQTARATENASLPRRIDPAEASLLRWTIELKSVCQDSHFMKFPDRLERPAVAVDSLKYHCRAQVHDFLTVSVSRHDLNPTSADAKSY